MLRGSVFFRNGAFRNGALRGAVPALVRHVRVNGLLGAGAFFDGLFWRLDGFGGFTFRFCYLVGLGHFSSAVGTLFFNSVRRGCRRLGGFCRVGRSFNVFRRSLDVGRSVRFFGRCGFLWVFCHIG